MVLVCADTTQLTPAELQIRTTLAYADVSADPARVCAACQQFVASAPDACGTCKILKGPVSPRGSCKSFLAKPAGTT